MALEVERPKKSRVLLLNLSANQNPFFIFINLWRSTKTAS